jgi:hypothetical protein
MQKRKFSNDSLSSLDNSDNLSLIPRDSQFEKISIIKPTESERYFLSPTPACNMTIENKKFPEERIEAGEGTSSQNLNLNIEEEKKQNDEELVSEIRDEYTEKTNAILSPQNNHKPEPMKIFQRRGTVYERLLQFNSKVITITSYEVRNVFFKFVRYGITISQSIKKTEVTVYRRYKEFNHLRDILKLKYFGLYIPSLPFKENFSHRDIAFIEFRKKFLQIFLHELQTLPLFDSNDDINAFLNPIIIDFLDFPIMNLNTIMNDDAILTNGLEFLKKRFYDKNLYLNNTGPKTLEIINKIKYYIVIFEKNREILKNTSIVLSNILREQKDFENQESTLINELMSFQEDFIFAMNPNINVFNYNTNKSLKETSKAFKETYQRMTRNRYKVRIIKNLNDWIYKELIDVEAIIEYTNSLFPFLDKVIEIDGKMHREAKDSYERHSFGTRRVLLKEIISVMSSYMLNIEIEKFKTMRVDFFYNSLRYMIINNDNINIDKEQYQELTSNFLEIMKMYLNNNPKLKNYYRSINFK